MYKTIIKLLVAAATLVIAFVASARDAHAAIDILMKLETSDAASQTACNGDVADAAFKNYFALKNYSFGTENPTTIGSATGGAGAGKVKFKELTVTRNVDAVSVCLAKVLATGAHFKTVTLAVRKAGGTAGAKPLLQFVFSTVFVTKQDWTGASADDTPTEAVTFAYGSYKAMYSRPKTEGAFETPASFGWDVTKNVVVP
jgi:type VI secretion system secreted protein Hcp